MESINKQEAGWDKLQCYFLKEAWKQSAYWRNKVTYDVIWEVFISDLAKQIVKPNPYDVYTAKHIALVGTGILPGLTPATNSLTGPVLGIQDVFAKKYGLRSYIPTIMIPYHFSLNAPDTYVYYSLQFPTLLETSPKTKTYPSLIANLREVKSLVEKFREESLHGNLPIEETPLLDFIKQRRLDYFHSESIDEDGLSNSTTMAEEDPKLVYYPNKTDTMKFSDKSRFVKGCIRISSNHGK
jgi:hypothetical protein